MSPRDGERHRRILYAAAFLRALGVGLMAVLIGLYASRLGLSAAQIGIVLSCALWGAALAALFPAADALPVMSIAAFIGMFNVHGRDRGAIPIVEQALLPATTDDAGR